MWHHPKYYKELRKLRNKLDQAISNSQATADDSVRPDPGLKQQAASESKPEPSSGSQAASDKHQAQSSKHQASSHKQQAQ